tara:strand:- start:374 stop:856 length:483 start_codon:yes stop_codon:yes gene_type:complete
MEILKEGQEEIWLPAVGYEGLYEISTIGNVNSLPKPYRPKLEPKITYTQAGCKRKSCCMTKDKEQRTHSVANMIAKAFIPNPDNYRFVRFKDNDETNHYVSNLYWSNCQVEPEIKVSPFRIKYEDDEKGTTIGAWMLSPARRVFQNNKEAIMQQIINERK